MPDSPDIPPNGNPRQFDDCHFAEVGERGFGFKMIGQQHPLVATTAHQFEQRPFRAAFQIHPRVVYGDFHQAPRPATSRYSSTCRRAVSNQEKLAARAGPAARRRSASTLSVSTASIADASPASSVGSMVTAASPTTSGSAELFDAMVGVPNAIASSGGSPKPSSSDGYTKTSAPV